jgi:Fe2+ or Zn2+ uptake regulation protein
MKTMSYIPIGNVFKESHYTLVPQKISITSGYCRYHLCKETRTHYFFCVSCYKTILSHSLTQKKIQS